MYTIIIYINVYRKYNKHTGHKDTEPFQEQDSELKRQIYLLNQEARKLNNSVQLHSPSFSVDLIYKTIVKKGDHRKPTNYYLTAN
jgi:hypothetical protein